jgi:hypothetical protein
VDKNDVPDAGGRFCGLGGQNACGYARTRGHGAYGVHKVVSFTWVIEERVLLDSSVAIDVRFMGGTLGTPIAMH